MNTCKHCHEPVGFSRFLDDFYCGDCRTTDTEETNDPTTDQD